MIIRFGIDWMAQRCRFFQRPHNCQQLFMYFSHSSLDDHPQAFRKRNFVAYVTNWQLWYVIFLVDGEKKNTFKKTHNKWVCVVDISSLNRWHSRIKSNWNNKLWSSISGGIDKNTTNNNNWIRGETDEKNESWSNIDRDSHSIDEKKRSKIHTRKINCNSWNNNNNRWYVWVVHLPSNFLALLFRRFFFVVFVFAYTS